MYLSYIFHALFVINGLVILFAFYLLLLSYLKLTVGQGILNK